MATYTENYNLKMPSGQDAPDVEDFNANAEIIDQTLKQHEDGISSLNSSKQNTVIRAIGGDLNDFLSLAFGYTSSSVTNKPPGVNNGYVEVLPEKGGDVCLQRYTVYNSIIQYERWYTSGAWGNWIKTRG